MPGVGAIKILGHVMENKCLFDNFCYEPLDHDRDYLVVLQFLCLVCSKGKKKPKHDTVGNWEAEWTHMRMDHMQDDAEFAGFGGRARGGSRNSI